ncbi:hypothetical protein [uncultured Pseudokineococcus sp.]|uniref:hypothetical protein n=1 Tax=uncultured Pseudokineococcus sp. TaxID=1642928 RepID=UPI00261F05D1|nr:hypothetical protein [uncultured Pseudokineococcus sp.]
MIVDCDGCAVRGPACSDCVVSVLLGMPSVREEPARAPGGARPGAVPGAAGDLDEAERAALGVLAGSGLVPPLRLVPVGPPADGAYDARRGGATRAG